MSIKVLCVIDYFLPGYLGGGPVTTIDNMRNQLRGLVCFFIYTRDRDLGSVKRYESVLSNAWCSDYNGEVFYSAPASFGFKSFCQAVKSRSYDIVYINSFFSFRGSILPLITLKYLGISAPVILAPRGEFSPGALQLKSSKKKLFLFLARLSRLHRNIIWHASTDFEKKDIQKTCNVVSQSIFIAPDPVFVGENIKYPASQKLLNSLKIAFISRLTPKKNLLGLIRLLSQLQSDVTLDIYGPIEDVKYWSLCEELIKTIPKNIKVKYCGVLRPDQVSAAFAIYNLFAFPTLGENFGHVIFEALRAGTPVLVSDQTPWRQDDTGAITVIPLHNESGWKEALEIAAAHTPEEHQEIRKSAFAYAHRYAYESKTKEANYDLFAKALNFKN